MHGLGICRKQTPFNHVTVCCPIPKSLQMLSLLTRPLVKTQVGLHSTMAGLDHSIVLELPTTPFFWRDLA